MKSNNEAINEAIGRREVGKVAWRSMINDLLDSEKEDLEDLRILRRKVSGEELQRIIGALLERKIERVLELELLLRYRDVKKEDCANGG